MVMITFNLDDKINVRLRAFIDSKWDSTYGRVTQVIEEALTAFLDAKETPK